MLIINKPYITAGLPIFVNKFNKPQKINANDSVNLDNINNLNYANKSLISFRGIDYYKTLQENYFNLPIDKSTNKPFAPDIYQKAAAENLYKGNDVIVAAPTGTGKTAIAHYIISKNLHDGKKTFYTTPLKALSNDKVREFRKIYGENNIGLITGDKKINITAPILIMTTEVYRNMVVKDNFETKNPILDNLKTVVFDELHYLGDVDRGGVWEQSIMFTDPKVQILSLSGTMANPERITDWMAKVKGNLNTEKIVPQQDYRANNDGIHVVLVNVPPENRHVPLEYIIESTPNNSDEFDYAHKRLKKSDKMNRLQSKIGNQEAAKTATPSGHSYIDMVNKLKEEDKLPAIFFIFSKNEGRKILQLLSKFGQRLTTEQEAKQIEKTIKEFEKSGKYLGESLHIEALKKGYSIHNAGMLPEQKELVEELFQKKLLKVVISTETLSAGINMPARTTVISALRKPTDNPDGLDHKRYLTPNEFHQMAGRAGRRGIDTKGYCYSMAVNSQQKDKFQELIDTPFNDIESHMNLDYSFVITAGDAFKDKDRLKSIFERSLFAYDENPEILSLKAEKMAKEFSRKQSLLEGYGYIDENSNLTLKGHLLTKLNGYEQIPIIDSIACGELDGLNPVQLAGYVGGLANFDVVKSEDLKRREDELSIKDKKIAGMVHNMKFYIKDYNENIYAPKGKELRQNQNAISHVYKWAQLNSLNEDSTYNWRDLYSGDMRRTIKDEGTLFREIRMTADLLKQMKDIVILGEKIAESDEEREYYKKLSDTINKSLDLISKEPTAEYDFI